MTKFVARRLNDRGGHGVERGPMTEDGVTMSILKEEPHPSHRVFIGIPGSRVLLRSVDSVLAEHVLAQVGARPSVLEGAFVR